MDARNVYASAEDTDDYGNVSYWNKNREANALTDRDVFRVFRDGKTSLNTYRVEITSAWFLRSIYSNSSFHAIDSFGGLIDVVASWTYRVRPHKMHEMYMHLEVMRVVVYLTGIRIMKQMH